MTLRCVSLLAASVLALTSFSSWAGQSAREARTHIEKVGAKEALHTWWGTQAWQDVYDGIASGKAEWLQVAELLRPVSDAGASEDLSDAISNALPKNPEGVLRFVKDGKDFEEFTVEGACFVSPRSETKSGALRFLKASERAVKKIKAADLKDTKARCLKSLAESRLEVQSWPAP
jgi:hypothetical protein